MKPEANSSAVEASGIARSLVAQSQCRERLLRPRVGITIPLGVGIGRLVFRALNLVEGVFALVLLVTLAVAWPPAPWTATIVLGLVLVLAIGAGVLRPRMDARVRRGELSEGQPRHLLHIGFVALETVKVLLLLALGILLLAS